MAIPYNPCKDGFHAKVWECLRRNAQFAEAFFGELDLVQRCQRGEIEEGGWYFRSHIDAYFHDWPMNYFAREVLVTCSDGWRLDAPWCDMDVKLRQRLAAQYKVEWPKVIEQPDLAACVTEQRFEAEKAVRLLRSAYLHGEAYDMIAVPRFIRDSRHHRAMIGQIRKLIKLPKADARWLKPNGRVLGREACWKSFVLFEAWERLGFSPKDAAHLTACERFGLREPLLHHDSKVAKQNAKISLGKRFKKHKHAAMVKQHVDDVRKAIASVFPAFEPFVD